MAASGTVTIAIYSGCLGLRTEFWRDKIESNRKRDLNTRASLANDGWRVLDVWECALIGKTSLEAAVWAGKIAEWLESDTDRFDIRGNEIGTR
ncbi:hypothetical protein ACRAQ6_11405 [Erythrobacter sp. HA6-11]